ncbi:MAG: hypothetical protein WAW02_15070 [Sideroxyarcus sp.]
MKITIYLLLAILAFSETTKNANASTEIESIPCQKWLDRQNAPAEGELYAVWLNGYLSGANAMYGEILDRDFIKNSDNISIVDWTEAYCRKYPKSTLQDSANALIKRLKRNLPF